jgi:predicted nucleic acid-binding protein
MAMTSVADTRLLLTMQFPPDNTVKDSIQTFVQKEISHGIILPSIVLSEFLKIAGSRIGIRGATRTISILKERGMKVRSIDEELALQAGKLLIKHTNVPFADSLIAAFVSTKIAEYVLSDDPHFRILGTKTRWLSP